MSESTLTPLGDRILVAPDENEKVTAAGIIIPDTTQEKPQMGTVLAVGTGKINTKGDREEIPLQEGDRVLFSKFGGTEIEVDKKGRIVLRESDILCKIEDE